MMKYLSLLTVTLLVSESEANKTALRASKGHVAHSGPRLLSNSTKLGDALTGMRDLIFAGEISTNCQTPGMIDECAVPGTEFQSLLNECKSASLATMLNETRDLSTMFDEALAKGSTCGLWPVYGKYIARIYGCHDPAENRFGFHLSPELFPSNTRQGMIGTADGLYVFSKEGMWNPVVTYAPLMYLVKDLSAAECDGERLTAGVQAWKFGTIDGAGYVSISDMLALSASAGVVPSEAGVNVVFELADYYYSVAEPLVKFMNWWYPGEVKGNPMWIGMAVDACKGFGSCEDCSAAAGCVWCELDFVAKDTTEYNFREYYNFNDSVNGTCAMTPSTCDANLGRRYQGNCPGSGAAVDGFFKNV